MMKYFNYSEFDSPDVQGSGQLIRQSWGISESPRYSDGVTLVVLDEVSEVLFEQLDDITMGHDIPAKEVFKTFKEINQLELVNQAGIRQQYIDQSVSLNLAFPSEATPKWLNKVHFDAWKNGVKTLYYTRTESVLRGDIAQQAMSEDCIACDG